MLFILPSVSVPKHNVYDETGAGDAYMGTMLALLFFVPFHKWDKNHVKKSAQAGAFAASLVIQSINSRLTQEQAELVKAYYHQR